MEIDMLSKKIIGCAYKVHNHLGPGFLEKLYENVLALDHGLSVNFGPAEKAETFHED
jgi:hypothetical protein